MRLILIVVSALLVSFMPLQSRVTPADIVFKNGNVYTANDKAPQAQAIAVKADRIVFVGTNAAAQRFVGTNTRVVDLQGKTVLPGFTDSHQHLSGVGQREMT
ncbi:MAG TPA: amidohydrolase family protein, partial [Pyrinomonadaceae bacterium]